MVFVIERQGFRGYIASRSIRGDRAAQHVQNLVIRDYAQRNGLKFNLSLVEYAMSGCYMMLESALEELPKVEGIILYSLYMLPQRSEYREDILRRILGSGAELHAALENISIKSWQDVEQVEDIFLVDQFAATAVPAI